MIEVISKWKSTDVTRLTIVEYFGRGKVQVDLLNNDERYGHVAYIWDLYVKEEYRRQGIARDLMDEALKRAKDFGYDTAILEWDMRDTPIEIEKWYESLGFEVSEFSNGYALMKKRLN